MIGILVTGHGHFASGLSSSLDLIAGTPENYEAVDFLASDSTETLSAKLKEALARLSGCTEGIVVFTDLAGGSPFKVAAELSVQQPQPPIVVVSGTSLGMLAEANMSRTFTESTVQEFADQIVELGKTLPMRFEYTPAQDTEAEDGEGI